MSHHVGALSKRRPSIVISNPTIGLRPDDMNYDRKALIPISKKTSSRLQLEVRAESVFSLVILQFTLLDQIGGGP